MRNNRSMITSALLATTALARAANAQDADAPDFSAVTDEIVVRGVNIPDEKRATSEISSILTPEKLQRQGDSDIAEALRRVTGLSLSQGKFIVVRGLNERYSNLTLNGSPLPSPEPLRRVAPLDIFPVSVIETALVQKTFSPEYSGEFGGGLIELRSKSIPDEPFLDISLKIGIDTETTARDGLTYDGGGTDHLGLPGGIRDLPAPLAAASAANPGVAIRGDTGVIDPAEIREIGASLANSEVRVIQEGSTPPEYGFSISGGHVVDLDSGMRIGVISSVGYSRDFQAKLGTQGDVGVGADGEATRKNEEFEFESLTEEILANALFGVGIEINENHELNLTALGLRKTTKEARERFGVNTDGVVSSPLLISNLEFFENQVWTVQGESQHIFQNISDLTVSLSGSYAEAYRDAPYETQFQYTNDGATAPESTSEFRSTFGEAAGAGSLEPFETRFSRVDDTSVAAGVDFELPLVLFDRDIILKTGYAYAKNERDYALRRFGFRNLTGLPPTDPFFYQRIDFLLADQNIGDGGFEFFEFPDQIQPQAYSGELETHGAYFGIDAEIVPYVRIAAGVRYEDGTQSIDNFNIAGINAPIANDPTMPEALIDESYFLPAATLTWNPVDDVQVRLGFSQTITRPQFQEFGDAFFTDTERDIQIFGNPSLTNTETDNFDARIEYYFGRDQFVTVGGFYKDMTRPIEEALFDTGDSLNFLYINAPSAKLYGAEFEFEKRFVLAGTFKGGGWLGQLGETKDLVFNANYTWSNSNVSADGDVTVNIPNASGSVTRPAASFFPDDRPLQGQSDHLVNVQIGYEDFEAKSKAFFLLNWSSERIRQVSIVIGGQPIPDVVERLPITLDFVYSRELDLPGGGWDLQAKVGNILNDDYEATADGANATSVPIDVYDLGTTFSLSLKKGF